MNLKNEYYHQREWDSKSGIPTREKLTELGLEDAI
jgi:aldehyde:ferredoxin oxidoreductase